MLFPSPLVEARLIRRYKRFFADMELADGSIITAHCANPGSMMGLKNPGLRTFLSQTDDPARKLKWSWELAEIDGAWVGVNTSRPNTLVAEAISAKKIAELVGYPEVRREVRINPSTRLDFLLTKPDQPDCYVEVKSVTLKRGTEIPGLAEFPDSVTLRGAKHLRELATLAATGARAVLLFIVQRTDCQEVALASDIDPAYVNTMIEAMAANIEVICYGCDITESEISIGRRIPFRLPNCRAKELKHDD